MQTSTLSGISSWPTMARVRGDGNRMPYSGGFQARTFTYTPEYFAVKHYSHFITKGSQVVAYKAQGDDRMPVLVSRTPEGKYVVVAGNFKDEASPLVVKIGEKSLSAELAAHSYNTFVMK